MWQGYEDSDWAELASRAEDAGAHILELNFSCPQMARPDAGHHVGQSFSLIEQYTRAAKQSCSIPVIAKMTPNITDMVPAALAAQEGGADGISAINTLKSISHVDLDTRAPMPTVCGVSSISGFSGPMGRPVALRFIAEMAKDPNLTVPLSGMGGIYTWRDAAEFLLLGASNLQMTTSVMRHGVRVVEEMSDGLQRYMRAQGFERVEDMIGLGLDQLVEPEKLDTQTEVFSVIDPAVCVGCGLCAVACESGANHAISLATPPASWGDDWSHGGPAEQPRVAVVDTDRCVGCELCQHVCPVDGAVSFKKRSRVHHPL